MIQLQGKPHVVWQTPDWGWQNFMDFCPQMATLSSVFSIGLKNIWKLSGTSASWLGISVILLCAVGYDFVSTSIVVMSLQMKFSAVFTIWVFSFPNWRFVCRSHRMLLIYLWIRAYFPFTSVNYSSSLYFIGACSSAIPSNMRRSDLVTDQVSNLTIHLVHKNSCSLPIHFLFDRNIVT